MGVAEGLPNPVVEPRSLTLQADSLPAEPSGECKDVSKDGRIILFICLSP